jgi:hypothetical protein
MLRQNINGRNYKLFFSFPEWTGVEIFVRSVLWSDVVRDVSRDSPIIVGTVHSDRPVCLSVLASTLALQYRFLRVNNCTNESAVDRECICFCA